MEFLEFPKMARLSRECLITEKIDGTNACLYIDDSDGTFLVGSRTRWITPEQDNHGFARWAFEHKGELLGLGNGRHFGEWWGSGIQRGYGLQKGEKRFSLFNATRWCNADDEPQQIPTADPRIVKMQERVPACCAVVPVISRALFSDEVVSQALKLLQATGSIAAPGFKNPEGIVVYHVAAGVGFKKTLEKDDAPKSKQVA